MTFLIFVAVFVALACLGVPLGTVALMAALGRGDAPLEEPKTGSPRTGAGPPANRFLPPDGVTY